MTVLDTEEENSNKGEPSAELRDVPTLWLRSTIAQEARAPRTFPLLPRDLLCRISRRAAPNEALSSLDSRKSTTTGSVENSVVVLTDILKSRKRGRHRVMHSAVPLRMKSHIVIPQFRQFWQYVSTSFPFSRS